MNHSTYPGAQQDLSQINRAIAQVRPPSLEDRLEHLHRAVERLQKCRTFLGSIADRVAMEPEAPSPGSGPASPQDLSSKFGELICWAHNNIDDIERLLHRLNSSLFAQETAAQAGRG